MTIQYDEPESVAEEHEEAFSNKEEKHPRFHNLLMHRLILICKVSAAELINSFIDFEAKVSFKTEMVRSKIRKLCHITFPSFEPGSSNLALGILYFHHPITTLFHR